MTIEKPKHPLHGFRNRPANEGPPTYLYEIVDPHHTPDLRGEFAGARVQGNKVRLTEAAAKFFVDSGSIRLVVSEE